MSGRRSIQDLRRTFREWMRKVNGLMLSEISVGTWSIKAMPYERWFAQGMKPRTAANLLIDMLSMGVGARRRR